MAEKGKPENLGWRRMVADAWFFPTLFIAMFGGALPIIALIQTLIVVHDFASPIREIITAYHHGMALFGAWAEPLLRPLLDWLGGLIGFKLHLYPHWRHILVLTLIVPMASIRQDLLQKGVRGNIVLPAVALIPFMLCGIVLAGLVDPKGGWWAQGLMAGLPSVVFIAGICLVAAMVKLASGNLKAAASVMGEGLAGGSLVVSFLFALAAGLSFVPGLHTNAGLFTLGGVVVFLGVLFVALGFGRNDHYALRFGLTVLGGFVGAGLLFAADWALKTYTA